MPSNLILPAAADRPEYESALPYWLDRHPAGSLMILESIRGFPLKHYDKVYMTILNKHENLHSVRSLLAKHIPTLGLEKKLKIVMLDEPTRNQPETVAKTIRSEGIKGSITVKDIDNFFDYSPVPGNSIAIFPLDSLKRVNPADKSYVMIDENQYVTNIIEKKIISRYFSAGAYVFDEADLFLRYYDKLSDCKPLYMSHVIYAMLLDRILFRPVKVKNYVDWGTEDDWYSFKRQYCTILVPLTAILPDDAATLQSVDSVLEHNRKLLHKLSDKGKARIIIYTEHGEEMRETLIEKLSFAGIKVDQLLCEVFSDHIQILKSPLEIDLL